MEQVQDQIRVQKQSSTGKTGLNTQPNSQISFQEIFDTKTAELKFSKHASSRLENRNIELSDEQMTRLKEGTDKASVKGIKESLVMVDNYAFIVNVPSKTVITAMDQSETNENIFTNIDGAVII